MALLGAQGSLLRWSARDSLPLPFGHPPNLNVALSIAARVIAYG
jgi:hypothetical protein